MKLKIKSTQRSQKTNSIESIKKYNYLNMHLKITISIIMIISFYSSETFSQSEFGTNCYPQFKAHPNLHFAYNEAYLEPNIERKDVSCAVGQISNETEISWSYGFAGNPTSKKRQNLRYRYILESSDITTALNGRGIWQTIYKSNLIKDEKRNSSVGGITYSHPVKENRAYRITIKYQYKGKFGAVWSTPKTLHSKPFIIEVQNQDLSMDQFVDFDLIIHNDSNGEYVVTAKQDKHFPHGLYYSWGVCEALDPNSWDCKPGTEIGNSKDWWKWQHQFNGYQGSEILTSKTNNHRKRGTFKTGKKYIVKHGVFGDNQEWIERKKMFTQGGVFRTDQ